MKKFTTHNSQLTTHNSLFSAKIYKLKTKNSGFTLVELLLSITMISVFLMVSGALFTRTLSEENRQQDQTFFHGNMDYAVDRIKSVVRDSKGINKISSDELSLVRNDGTITTFYLSAENIIKEKSEAPSILYDIDLTSDDEPHKISITSANFTRSGVTNCGGYDVQVALEGVWKGSQNYTATGSAMLFETNSEVIPTPPDNVLGLGDTGKIKFASSTSGHSMAVWVDDGELWARYIERYSTEPGDRFVVPTPSLPIYYDVVGTDVGFAVVYGDGFSITAVKYFEADYPDVTGDVEDPGRDFMTGVGDFSLLYKDGSIFVTAISTTPVIGDDVIMQKFEVDDWDSAGPITIATGITATSTPYADSFKNNDGKLVVTYVHTPGAGSATTYARTVGVDLTGLSGAIIVGTGSKPKVKAGDRNAMFLYRNGATVKARKAVFDSYTVSPTTPALDGYLTDESDVFDDTTIDFSLSYDGVGSYAVFVKDSSSGNLQSRTIDENGATVGILKPIPGDSDPYVYSDSIGRSIFLYLDGTVVKYQTGEWLCH